MYVCLSVVEPHTPAYSRIVYHFGPEILLENGEIDRQKLGQLIFTNEEKRKLLNSITHPEIHKAMLKEILFYFLRGAEGESRSAHLAVNFKQWKKGRKLTENEPGPFLQCTMGP